MNAASTWFIRFQGEETNGPFTEQEIRSFLYGPQYREDCFVKQGQSDWQPASRVKMVFETFDQNGYYYKQADKTVGPFTRAKLHELYAQTKILPATLVKQGVNGQWMHYSELSSEALQPPALTPPIPHLHASVLRQSSPNSTTTTNVTHPNAQRINSELPQLRPYRNARHKRRRSRRSIATLLQAVFAIGTAFAVFGTAIALMWTTNIAVNGNAGPSTDQSKKIPKTTYKALRISADESSITIAPDSIDKLFEHIRHEVRPIPKLISFTNYGFIERRPQIFEAYVPRGTADFNRMGYDYRGGILLLMESERVLWAIKYTGRIDLDPGSRMTISELHINPDFGTRYIERSYTYEVYGEFARKDSTAYAYIRSLDGNGDHQGDRVHYSIHPDHNWYGVIFESFSGLYFKLFHSTTDVQASMASPELAKLLAFLRQTRIDHMP